MKKVTLIFLFCSIIYSGFSQSKIWKKTTVSGEFQGFSIEKIDKNNSELLELDFAVFKQQLVNVSLRGGSNISSNIIINLPDHKGDLEAFRILEAPVLSRNLSAKFPEIKSYVGFSAGDSGAIVRMSVSPEGV